MNKWEAKINEKTFFDQIKPQAIKYMLVQSNYIVLYIIFL